VLGRPRDLTSLRVEVTGVMHVRAPDAAFRIAAA
jgi:hypothetical protein